MGSDAPQQNAPPRLTLVRHVNVTRDQVECLTTQQTRLPRKAKKKKKRRVCNTFLPYGIVMQAHSIPLVGVRGSLSLFFFLRCEGEMKNDACVHVTGGS